MPVFAKVRPIDIATKDVFVSAIQLASSISEPCPPFGDELKTSAQEQVVYMLREDKDTSPLIGEEEVKSAVKTGVAKICFLFESKLSLLLLEPNILSDAIEDNLLHCVSDLEWLCSILPKLDLMIYLVSDWIEISNKVVAVVEDKKLDSSMWHLKLKTIELAGKIMEAVGYGNVILVAPCRVRLLKTWLPYIRKMQPILDIMGSDETGYPYRMNEDLCQSIEGAIISLVLALPSNDQADILADWINSKQLRFPDLSGAYEIWCYRTKSANRRLADGLDMADDTTASL